MFPQVLSLFDTNAIGFKSRFYIVLVLTFEPLRNRVSEWMTWNLAVCNNRIGHGSNVEGEL